MEAEAIARVLAALGFAWLFKSTVVFFIWIWKTFLRPGRELKEHYGSWALITGPTDGIGKALAFSLGKKGLNLVLVGRNPEKLASVSHEIRESDEKIEVKSVVVDFSRDKIDEGIKAIEEEIQDLDLGVVVNNVGVCYAMYMHEVGEEQLQEFIRVNVEAATRVTHMVLPHMMKRKKKKKKGAIVNIGSAAALPFWGFPFVTVYCATKRFLDKFSTSLHMEYKRHGIDIQCQTPLFVATKMTGMERSFFLVASSAEYAESSIRWMGYEGSCNPFWGHAVQCWIASLLPQRLLDCFLLRFFHDQTEKALPRLADESSASST
ncbi:very-long-chain 3-oxoacyl-CoA reductase 1-like [Nymphaea colorata]|nr:very-long-chain 3-oxoacyl-CoA reductase 1-like [Nymphaea colorata]XP_031477500.1 very-long-chain 3-oxoacyl-CoA reductase 1-like [Nymphaea colorata]XP_031477501.1 very-long-chain 3-oxoacyl-CoA reductase 1-like [Nymphaea colorata]XP_049932304.1 very-long-chain 3-oxoacyl-CoA reductase 1-like [Nymphaea colorata]XP_049932305.1 very-long-chain 3-oxoacyl-CoA reductase 1-like [Nymphaea colorata]